MPLDVTISNLEKVKITLAPVNSVGGPASVDGVPSWEVVSGDSTVEPSEDGLSAELISADDPGDTQIIVKADADLGSGVTDISDMIRLTVQGAQAASLGLTVGTPKPK